MQVAGLVARRVPLPLAVVFMLNASPSSKAEKITCERQAASGKPDSNSDDTAPNCRTKPEDDKYNNGDSYDDRGDAGQPGMAYKVTVKYRVV